MRAERITIKIESGPLKYKNHPVKIADDKYGGKARINCHFDGEPQLEFLKQFSNLAAITLVDIGANVGLFARQALVYMSNVRTAFCYEPDPTNFADLCYNLLPWHGPRTMLHELALGVADGETPLYRDPDNCGNYSMAMSAMPDVFDSITAKMRCVNDESKRWLSRNVPVFYKSDVQGLDEWLATSIEETFWPKCCGVMIELWPIEKPKLDTYRFRQFVNNFKHRKLLSIPDREVTADFLFERFVNPPQKEHDDLILWN